MQAIYSTGCGIKIAESDLTQNCKIRPYCWFYNLSLHERPLLAHFGQFSVVGLALLARPKTGYGAECAGRGPCILASTMNAVIASSNGQTEVRKWDWTEWKESSHDSTFRPAKKQRMLWKGMFENGYCTISPTEGEWLLLLPSPLFQTSSLQHPPPSISFHIIEFIAT